MDISAMIAANLTLFGEAVSYTPKGGVLVSISKALWDEQTPALAGADEGRMLDRTVILFVSSTDVASPQRGATVVRSSTSESWIVDRVESVPGGARLFLNRETPAEATVGKYHRY